MSKEHSDERTPDNRDRKGYSLRSAVIWGLAIGLTAGVLRLAATLARQDSTEQVIEGARQLLPALAILAFLVLLAAWLFVFKLTWRGRLISLGILLASVTIVACLFRVESFYGSIFPRLVWRWSSTPEETLQEYLRTRPAAGEIGRPLSLTGAHGFPGFLGAERLGVVRDVRLATDWVSRPPRLLWRHAVGLGWSGFSAAGDYAFTQEQRGPDETIVAYELQTGREIWLVSDPVDFHPTHGDGPRATPTIHAGKVYAFGATGILSCVDAASGTRLWRRPMFDDPDTQNLAWGMAGSPLVVGRQVIVSPGVPPDHFLVALDVDTGEEVWSAGDQPAAYASPLLASICNRDQLIIFGGAGLSGHDVASGRCLWAYPWVTHRDNMANIAQPVVLGQYGDELPRDQIAISSGYGMGCALLQIEDGGGGLAVRELWRNRNLQAKFSNMVVRGNCLYGLDNGVLVCLDLQTGERTWKSGRYGHGQLLLVEDLLLIQAESGDVALVKASPDDLVELGRIPALSAKTWNHMALAGSILLVRNDREAAAFELPLAE